jgi:predicted transcriptional regulator
MEVMEQSSARNEVDPRLVERIVSSYVRHHNIAVDQLSGLIAEVHRVLAGLGSEPASAEARTPAVPVRRSVQQDHVVCLDCGYRGMTLRRHIRAAHGLEPAAYRDRWKLLVDHPLTAPSYSARRSTLAIQLGLGRSRRREAAAPPAAPATPTGRTTRRGRPPKRSPATT